MITPADLRALTAAERAVVLDVGQVALDIVGIFDPTPTTDLTNAVISLVRADFFGAAVSAVSAIPYAGDLAKFANLPRYTKRVEDAIALARNDARLAAVLKPVLSSLVSAIDAIPVQMIPKSAIVPLETLRNKILAFVGKRVLRGVELQTDEMLVALMGSAVNVGALPRRNVRFLVEYLNRQKVLKSGQTLLRNGKVAPDAVDIVKTFKGMDLHAVDAFTTVSVKPGKRFHQWGVELKKDVAEKLMHERPDLSPKIRKSVSHDGSESWVMVGDWFLTPGSGVNHTRVGLSANGRVLHEFEIEKEAEFLVTKAQSTRDSWTHGRTDSFPLSHSHPKDAAELVQGGGEQLFLPDAFTRVRPVPRHTTKPAFPAVKR